MTAQGYQQLIREEIKNLPGDQPHISPQEMRDMTIAVSRKQLSAESKTHLAEEFEDYAVDHPKE